MFCYRNHFNKAVLDHNPVLKSSGFNENVLIK